ncbi:MAG TPA: baseplate J/gp47 family protein [Burkholderiaceae bacterium]
MKRVARTAFSADLIIHDGLSQEQRGLPGLQPGYFNVHEMPFATLLSQAVDYAGLMSYYDGRNHADGNWGAFFKRDETVVMADILSNDLTQAGAMFEAALAHAGNAPELYLRSVDLPPDCAAAKKMSSYVLAKTMDAWSVALTDASSQEGVELRRLLDSVIEGLSGELDDFKQMMIQAGISSKGIEKIFSLNFSNTWLGSGGNGTAAMVSAMVAERSRTAMEEGRSDAKSETTSIFSLRANFYSFVKAMEMIQLGARRLLEGSMQNQTHDPAIGMLIAFARQFERVQARINRFTQSHLDFYYDRVLMVEPRGFVPDSTILVLRPSVKGNQVPVPAETQFLAGLDEKKRNILYASDSDLNVSDVTVCSLYSILFERDRLNFPENEFLQAHGKRQRQLATGCYLASIPVNPDADVAMSAKMQTSPLFGAQKDMSGKTRAMRARLGFAVASRSLYLKEGQRSVSVTISFDGGGDIGSLEEQVSKLTLVLKRAKDEAGGQVQGDQEAFFRVFQDMFSLSLTTATGWYALPEYLPSYSKVEPTIKKNSLVLKFSLAPDCPAIVGYDAKLHGENYATELPVLRCTINSNNYIFAYEFLRGLAVREIRIDVDAHGCRDLLLYNQIGQLAPMSPFAPFGPIPSLGTYFIAGNAEIAIKQLTAFDLDVEWGNLPLDLGGFKTYYRGYGNEIDNSDFQARVSVLLNGKWSPPENSAIAPVILFDTEPDDSVSAQANLPCGDIMHFYKPLDIPKPGSVLAYTPSTRGGFFKFTLCAPNMAFGHQEYPNMLARVLTANARQKVPQLIETVPNAPYTPTITSIEMHYAAFSVVDLMREPAGGRAEVSEQFIQLHPLGWESMRPSDHRSVNLFPQYDLSGNLFIGLDGSAIDGILTLFFHLGEDSLPMDHKYGSGPEWSYLCNNRWLPLSTKQVVSDTTEGFMTSGIVTLDLPQEMTKGNTVMPGDFFWLKLSAEYDLEKFCSVYSIYSQALKVVWQADSKAPSTMPDNLAAGTITKSRQTIPGIGRISQIGQSTGGRRQETREQTRVRMSERLRHKNRALSAADYEMLILEQFPSIYRVKCFANMAPERDPAKRVRPGHLLIVPVPKLPPNANANQMPMLSGHLIGEVKEFVMKLAPQFATIKVANPVYEQIQVRCTVKLKKGLRGGRYTSMLNQAVSEFLSPWKNPGYATHFGWCVRQHDLESFIQDQAYVEDVTNFSMLRIAPEGDNNFELLDTAAVLAASAAAASAESSLGEVDGTGPQRSITPKYPWSIAVPLKHHAIDTTDDFTPQAPIAAGVDELEIGATFIVSSGN